MNFEMNSSNKDEKVESIINILLFEKIKEKRAIINSKNLLGLGFRVTMSVLFVIVASLGIYYEIFYLLIHLKRVSGIGVVYIMTTFVDFGITILTAILAISAKCNKNIYFSLYIILIQIKKIKQFFLKKIQKDGYGGKCSLPPFHFLALSFHSPF